MQLHSRPLAVGTVTLIAILVGYLGVRAQIAATQQPSNSFNGRFSAHEREEAVLSCLKMQADGCYME